jgi:hypothetical protein
MTSFTCKSFASAALAASLVACGGEAREPKSSVATEAKPSERPHKRAMGVSGQLGSLDPRQVDQTFNGLAPKFGKCLGEGGSRIEFIGGHVKFFVRIGLDGRARWAYLSESTLGDRATERCMLDVVRGAHWPPPLEGEGQAQKSFEFDPSPDIRQAVVWSSERVDKPLAGARAKLDQCRAGAPGRYHITMYVQTDGSALSAGVATPSERGEASAADCIAEAIKTVKFPSPGSWPAKAEFQLD